MVEGKVVHPYYPRNLIIPHYVPNNTQVLHILVAFFGTMGIVLLATWFFTGKKRRNPFTCLERFKLVWFINCGIIHCVIEGYFSIFHKTFPGEQGFLAQMWKEYGKADSRYITSDSFTVCMESITAAIDGPLSFLAFYAFIKSRPYRYTVQLIVSLCQLYGDVLYFLTEIKEDFIHGEKYHPLHFWFYFVTLNALWIIIPLICIYESWNELSIAQTQIDNKNKKNK